MISIIISSYKPDLYAAVSFNIKQTVGIDFEIIKIDNPGKYSLCEAYNIGAQKAQFENLLFVHDDVIFETNNWGEILCEYLSHTKTGIIGVAGSNYVPSAPSGWFIARKDLIETTDFDQAIAIDGVFMAISKTHFNEILFNEKILGYHGYDLDFSLRTAQKHQNYIIRNIHITHLSAGKIEKAFLDNNIQIRSALGSSFQNYRDSRLERLAFLNFLNLYFKYYPANFENILKTLRFLPISKFKGKNLYSFLKAYLRIIKYRNSLV